MSASEFEHLRGRTVDILTPIYRDPSLQYHQSLIATLSVFHHLDVRWNVRELPGDANLPRVRNHLAASFLAGGAKEALFIDADMEWKPEDVLRLLSSKQPFIGAPCRRRRNIPEHDPNSWNVRFFPDRLLKQDAAGAIEVEAVGTGFLRVERTVFERIIAAHPDWKASPSVIIAPKDRDWYYRVFRFPEGDDGGEDQFFCQAWRSVGGQVWIDPRLSIGHVGEQVYRGSVMSLFRRAPAPATVGMEHPAVPAAIAR